MPKKDYSSQVNRQDIMVKLKNATGEWHSRLEVVPYFEALKEHELPLDCYIRQLRALGVIHGIFESEISTSRDKDLRTIWKPEMNKLSLIESDLKFLKPRVDLSAIPSVGDTNKIAEKIRLRNIEHPKSLLGYLYVYEGSTLGNQMHQPDVAATFHLPGHSGCRYYSSYEDRVKENWISFSRRMNSTLKDQSDHSLIVEAAVEAFSDLERLYKSLYPPEDSEEGNHITWINPEAGNHPVPKDELEILAALKASERAWKEFPYNELRFGMRGKRFSDSDCCWLATLTVLETHLIEEQLEWFATVLSSRGMPGIMLEKTLGFLYDELAKAVPDKKSLYARLLDAESFLKNKRLAVINQEQVKSLRADFENKVDSELHKKYKNSSHMLISLVIDEIYGRTNNDRSLESWMKDPSRFPEEWITAVEDLLNQARSCAE